MEIGFSRPIESIFEENNDVHMIFVILLTRWTLTKPSDPPLFPAEGRTVEMIIIGFSCPGKISAVPLVMPSNPLSSMENE